jgi:hypothetical protein
VNTETASSVVVADRFPVQLIDAERLVHASAKLFLTRPDENGVGRLLAYEAPDVALYDIAWSRPDSTIGPNGVDWLLETGVGRLIVRSAPGCGCGNRLKGWVPQELQPYRLGRLV